MEDVNNRSRASQTLKYLRHETSDMPTKATGEATVSSHSRALKSVRSKFNTYDFYTKNHRPHKGEFSKSKLAWRSTLVPPRRDCFQILESYFLAKKADVDNKKRETKAALKKKSQQLDHNNRERHELERHRDLTTSPNAGMSLLDKASPPSMSSISSLINQRRRSSVIWVRPVSEDVAESERKRRRSIRTFRWYAWFVRSLVGLLMHMQKLSISLTQQSAYAEFLYILGGARSPADQEGQEDNQHLLFDKSWFARTRAWSKMPVWAQQVMYLPPDERTPEDVQHLKQLLTTMRAFRENVTDIMRNKLCQVVRYTKCDKGRVVLRQGHIGYDFYFVFSGSVFVQIEVYDDRTAFSYTHVENVIKSGEGFGEIAILGDGHRTATIICKEPTELCQIDKATFLEVCPALFNQHLQEKVNFAKQFDIFQNWETEPLRQVCFLSQVLDVPHSTVVEKNWATSGYVYFVMKGRMNMMKEFDITDIMNKTGQVRNTENGSVLGSKVTVQGDRHLKNIRFASVGTLTQGSCSDLSLLSVRRRRDIPPITLVSEGVRLFRVAVRTFKRLSPRKYAENYIKNCYKPMTFPTESELCVYYLNDLNWSEFKKNMIHTCRLQIAGHVMASIPATLKGSTGWARWPGYVVLPKITKLRGSISAVELANTSKTPVNQCTHLDDDDMPITIDDRREEDEEGSVKNRGEHFLTQSSRLCPSPLDLDTTDYKIISDRSMTLIPKHTRTLTSLRKSIPESPDYNSCTYVFQTSLYSFPHH